MCAAGTVDAVYVATPHEYHVVNVRTAAAHGKHVLVEKPMALTVAECRAMIEATDAAGVTLIVGHTHAFDPAVAAMRAIVCSGRLGRLRMITNLVYSDFLYRPRRPEELDTARGGGIMFNQVPHQIEIARALDGGPLRSVKAIAGRWDELRPTEGALAALLEFEDGVAASLVYNGYDRFDSDEFHFGIGEMGAPKTPIHGAARRALRSVASPAQEAALKASSGFAGHGATALRTSGHLPHFGLLIASCEGGDLRPSPDGVFIYDDDGLYEEKLPAGRAFPNKDLVIDELYDAVVRHIPPLHDGRWGLATLEASLALLQSSRERREIVLPESAAL
ncbi:MAG: Gfo/Idh/MocA family oxidoreductase [Candidatus Velthaea sp.]